MRGDLPAEMVEDGGEEVVLRGEDVGGVSLVGPVPGEEVDVGGHGEDPAQSERVLLLGATHHHHHHDLVAGLAVRLYHRPAAALEALGVVVVARTAFEAAAARRPLSAAVQALEYTSLLHGAGTLNAYT